MNNKTYFDGQAAAFYKQRPPLVNACRGPGLWQCYDTNPTQAGTLKFQDHNNPVRYRNIWFAPKTAQ